MKWEQSTVNWKCHGDQPILSKSATTILEIQSNIEYILNWIDFARILKENVIWKKKCV